MIRNPGVLFGLISFQRVLNFRVKRKTVAKELIRRIKEKKKGEVRPEAIDIAESR
jgi:hypothetical protein